MIIGDDFPLAVLLLPLLPFPDDGSVAGVRTEKKLCSESIAMFRKLLVGQPHGNFLIEKLTTPLNDFQSGQHNKN